MVMVPVVMVMPSMVMMMPAVAASIMATVVAPSISPTATPIPAAVALSKNLGGQPEHRKDEQYRFDRHVNSYSSLQSTTPHSATSFRQTMTLAWFYGKSSNFWM